MESIEGLYQVEGNPSKTKKVESFSVESFKKNYYDAPDCSQEKGLALMEWINHCVTIPQLMEVGNLPLVENSKPHRSWMLRWAEIDRINESRKL